MMEGLAAINSKLASLANTTEGLLSGAAEIPFAPASFLAELLEKLRTLDGQLMGVLLGQLPSDASNLTNFSVTPSLPNLPLSMPSPVFPTSGLKHWEGEAPTEPANFAAPTESLLSQSGLITEHLRLTNGNSNGSGLDKFAIQRLVIETSRRYGIEPALALAVAKAESDFEPNAVSPKGAMGVMQLMPETARSLGVLNPFDPVQNIDGGIRYLKRLLEQFGGNITLAVAAYNAGPNAVRRYGGVPPYPETQNFVRRVLAYREVFRKELPIDAKGFEADGNPLNLRRPSDPVSHQVSRSDQFHFRPQNPLGSAKEVIATGAPAVKSTLLVPTKASEGHVEHEHVLLREPVTKPEARFMRENEHSQTSLNRVTSQVRSSNEASPTHEQGWKFKAVSSFTSDEVNPRGQISTLPNSPQTSGSQLPASNPEPLTHPKALTQLSHDTSSPQVRSQENAQTSAQAVVHRLTVEVPVADGGERVRLQISLPGKAAEVPTVQVSVRVSDEQLATQLAQQFPTLRQHLWEQGIVLAQWTVVSGWWEGGRRDPAEYFGDWRRLPSASHNRLPTNFIPDEGTWA